MIKIRYLYFKKIIGYIRLQLPENPTSLADYGYHFNDEGELRHIETGTPFQFINQKHYEAMGDMIVRHIQNAMLQEYKLTEQIVPLHEVGARCCPPTEMCEKR